MQTKYSLKLTGIKLALFVAYTAVVLLSASTAVLLCLFACVVVGLCKAHIPRQEVVALLKLEIVIFCFTFLAQVLVVDGSADLVLFSSVGILYAGFARAVFSFLRISCLVCSALWFLALTSSEEIMQALALCLRPLAHLGLKAQAVAQVIALMVAFIPLSLKELSLLSEAHLVRASRLQSKHPLIVLKSLVATFVSLVRILLKKASMRGLAMEARGWTSDE